MGSKSHAYCHARCSVSLMSVCEECGSSSCRPIFSSGSRSIVFPCPLSMQPEFRNKGEKPFAGDVCDHRFTTTGGMRQHKQAVHGDEVFTCSQSGCQFSSSWKTSLAQHAKGFHGTAGSLACYHPGCTFRSTWRASIDMHKRQVHSDEKHFACDHTGCSFRTKTRSDLSRHKKSVHLNIRDKQCHVCEKGFPTKSQLKSHMTTHEEDGHEMETCEDCSVNLRVKSSHKTNPAAGKSFQCHHQGCDYNSRRKSVLLFHRKQAHSLERPFSCSYTGCSFRCKTKGNLTKHQKYVHQKIRTKRCHVCDKRFFSKAVLCAHMMSQHQTKDHDMSNCDDCVTYLKKNLKMSQARAAVQKRRAKDETNLIFGNKLDMEYNKRKSGGKKENSFALKEVHVKKSETTGRLNDDLIDMHMDMQLLSSL